MSDNKQQSNNIIDKTSEKISEQFSTEQTNPYIDAGKQEAIKNRDKTASNIEAGQKASSKQKETDKAPTSNKADNEAKAKKQDQEKSIEADKIGDKPIKPIPEELNNKYVISGDEDKGKYYFKDKPDQEAFRDKGSKLITKSTASAVAKSMVALAESKQWETIKLTGSDKFKREVWMEAKLRGLEVNGYKPSKQDLQNLEDRQNKIENATTNVTKKAVVNTAVKVATQATPPKEQAKTTTEVNSENKTKDSAVDSSISERRTQVWKNETIVNPENNKPTLSTADKKVIEIRDRLDKAEKDKQNIDKFVAKDPQTASDKKPLADGQVSKERENKDELRKAYSELSKEDAIKKYPGLEPLYNLEKAAQQFTDHNKGKFDTKGKERFINSVREKALNTLAKGDKLPVIQERAPQARQSEKDAEVSR
mgnify:CR=1 FL=1